MAWISQENSIILTVQSGDRDGRWGSIVLRHLKISIWKNGANKKKCFFWHRGLNDRNIALYGVKTLSANCFNLSLLNSNIKEESSFVSTLFLFGPSLCFLGYGVYELLNNKRTANMIWSRCRTFITTPDLVNAFVVI